MLCGGRRQRQSEMCLPTGGSLVGARRPSAPRERAARRDASPFYLGCECPRLIDPLPTWRRRVPAGNFSPTRFWVRSPGFSRPRAQPAEAGTPNRSAIARFMDRLDIQTSDVHWDHEPGTRKIDPGLREVRDQFSGGQFMQRRDIQVWMRIGAMNVTQLSKVETRHAMATDSTLESRATRRFMGSLGSRPLCFQRS